MSRGRKRSGGADRLARLSANQRDGPPPLSIVAALSLIAFGADAGAAERELRVCADPNNLPFSNERQEGFENRIAELIADELDAALS